MTATVIDEHLGGHDDHEIWTAAQRECRFLITQDLDFSNARRYIPGTHEGILLLRLRSPDRRTLAKPVYEIFSSEAVEQWRGCFVIASERKLRLLKPKT